MQNISLVRLPRPALSSYSNATLGLFPLLLRQYLGFLACRHTNPNVCLTLLGNSSVACYGAQNVHRAHEISIITIGSVRNRIIDWIGCQTRTSSDLRTLDRLRRCQQSHVTTNAPLTNALDDSRPHKLADDFRTEVAHSARVRHGRELLTWNKMYFGC
jgi:hypothetical protein